jgi:hypothetical protein
MRPTSYFNNPKVYRAVDDRDRSIDVGPVLAKALAVHYTQVGVEEAEDSRLI